MAFSSPHIILSRGPGTEAVRASQTHTSLQCVRQHGGSKADFEKQVLLLWFLPLQPGDAGCGGA